MMMEIQTFNLGPLQTNCYVLCSGGEAVVIDPGGDPTEVIQYLRGKNCELPIILNTHLHFDHIQGNSRLRDEFASRIMASAKDAFLLQTEIGGGGFIELPEIPKFEYEDLPPGEYQFAGNRCAVLATPGHSPGSLSFYFPESGAVFCGDLIFRRSIGRTDLPGGEEETLIRSAREKIFSLPWDTAIYPGHGPKTQVRDEELHSPFFSKYAGL